MYAIDATLTREKDATLTQNTADLDGQNRK